MVVAWTMSGNKYINVWVNLTYKEEEKNTGFNEYVD